MEPRLLNVIKGYHIMVIIGYYMVIICNYMAPDTVDHLSVLHLIYDSFCKRYLRQYLHILIKLGQHST